MSCRGKETLCVVFKKSVIFFGVWRAGLRRIPAFFRGFSGPYTEFFPVFFFGGFVGILRWVFPD